jgi:ribosome-interacting GTPase 1
VAGRGLLELELDAVGIRLNKPPPNIYFKVRRYGPRAETLG